MKVPDFVALILNVLLFAFAAADPAPLSGFSSGLAFQPSLPSVGLAIRTSPCSSQQPVAQERHKNVKVYDEVVSVALGLQLVTELKGSAGEKLELSRMVPVPSSLHEKIMCIMQDSGTNQVVPRQTSTVQTDTVLVPARVSSEGISPHQVCSSSCQPLILDVVVA
jgi:hypothetical protein